MDEITTLRPLDTTTLSVPFVVAITALFDKMGLKPVAIYIRDKPGRVPQSSVVDNGRPLYVSITTSMGAA